MITNINHTINMVSYLIDNMVVHINIYIMKKKKYIQGTFKPKFPDKWINIKKGIPIVYRSSWEKKNVHLLR